MLGSAGEIFISKSLQKAKIFVGFVIVSYYVENAVRVEEQDDPWSCSTASEYQVSE